MMRKNITNNDFALAREKNEETKTKKEKELVSQSDMARTRPEALVESVFGLAMEGSGGSKYSIWQDKRGQLERKPARPNLCAKYVKAYKNVKNELPNEESGVTRS